MTHTNISASRAFIAGLLAPPPTKEEQADTSAYRREVIRDMYMPWAEGKRALHVLEARATIACDDFIKSGERYFTDQTPFAVAASEARWHVAQAIDRQCLIPAPTVKELRWKRRKMRLRVNVPVSVASALEADAIRLEGGR